MRIELGWVAGVNGVGLRVGEVRMSVAVGACVCLKWGGIWDSRYSLRRVRFGLGWVWECSWGKAEVGVRYKCAISSAGG